MTEEREYGPEVWAKLREPFPPEAVAQLPKPTSKDAPKGKCTDCGGYHGLPAVHIDYVGHAEVTDRLLSVDPWWNWAPLALDNHGLPLFDRLGDGRVVGLWIKLTVCGVTRLGYGSVAAGAFDAEKQLIGDALRNAAMRFGVALDLWSKSERAREAMHEDAPPPARRAVTEQANAASSWRPQAHPAPAPQPASAGPAAALLAVRRLAAAPVVSSFDPDTGEVADDLPFDDGRPTHEAEADDAAKEEWVNLLSAMVKPGVNLRKADILPIIGEFTPQAFARWLDGHAGRSAQVCIDTALAAKKQAVRA